MTNEQNIQYQALDKYIKELTEIREAREHLDQSESELKQTIQKVLNEMDTETYKNDTGVLSLKKMVKYSYDEDEVIEYLQKNNVVLYLDTEPRIKKNFDKDLRADKLQGGWPKDIALEKVETQQLAYRPNKQKDENS